MFFPLSMLGCVFPLLFSIDQLEGLVALGFAVEEFLGPRESGSEEVVLI